MIKLQVIGRVGKDANVQQVNGKSVINFSVCHSEKYKDAQGNQQEKSVWVDCGYWTDKTAIAPFIKKGTQVYVEGTPDIRTHEGKAYQTLKVLSVQLLGGSSNNEQQQTASQPQQQTSTAAPVQHEPLDDLPF